MHEQNDPAIDKIEKLRKSNPKLFEKVADAQYQTMKYFNGRLAQVKVGGRVRIVDLADRNLVFYPKEEIAQWFTHLWVLDWDGDSKPAFKWWLQQHDRNQYAEVVFEPDLAKAPKDALNLFRGFNVKPQAKPGGWSMFADHLHRNVCAGDMRLCDYLQDIFAHYLQRAGQKVGIAVVLYGDKGSGKSVVGDVLAECIGQQYCPVVDTPEALTQKHNSHLARAILVRVEEALHAKDPRHEARLKHMITGGRFLIEPKNVDAFEIDSKANFIFTTNKAHSVPASGGERRFFCLRVANHNQQDGDFFKAMLAQMKDGGYAAFVADLLARDISKTNFNRPPATALLSTQIVESMTGIERWWCSTLANGRLPFAHQVDADHADVEWPPEASWTTPKALVQESASAYAKDYQGPPTPEAVGKFLSTNVPGLQKTRRQSHGDREHVYVFPPLSLCREAFVSARPGLLLEHVSDPVPEAPLVRAGAGGEVVQLLRTGS